MPSSSGAEFHSVVGGLTNAHLWLAILFESVLLTLQQYELMYFILHVSERLKQFVFIGQHVLFQQLIVHPGKRLALTSKPEFYVVSCQLGPTILQRDQLLLESQHELIANSHSVCGLSLSAVQP